MTILLFFLKNLSKILSFPSPNIIPYIRKSIRSGIPKTLASILPFISNQKRASIDLVRPHPGQEILNKL